MKKRTKNLSAAVIRDALGVAGGLYSMNAPYASGYGFNPHMNNKEVASGEFLSSNEENDYIGYIDFQKKTINDLESNESIPIENFRK